MSAILRTGSYLKTFVSSRDGRVNDGSTPDGLAPAGLYVFDLDVIGIAPGYDEDWLRSRALRVGEHEIIFPLPSTEQQPFFYSFVSLQARALYILRGNYLESQVRIDVYNTDFSEIMSINGATVTIPEDDPVDFPQGHFVAGGYSGLGGDMRVRFINNVMPYLRWVKRWLPDPFSRWSWRRAYIGYGYWAWEGPGTQPRLMHPVQEWNRDIVLKRIACVEILTLMAHGNYDKMGRFLPIKGGYDLVTSDDIRQRYEGYWTYWNPITRKPETRQGLHHLRVVLLMGCKTGGKPTGDEEDIEAIPASGSIADTFYQLCARVVIYSEVPSWGPVNEEFVKRFYRYATVGGMTVVEAAKKARKELMEEELKGVSGRYQTAVRIRLIKKQGAENLYLAP